MTLKSISLFIRNEIARNINLVKYGIIGIIGLGVEFTVFYAGLRIIGLHYLIANVFSVILATTHNFLLNAFFNFKATDKLTKRYIKYFSFAILGLLLSTVILYVLVDIFLLNELISKAVVLSFVVSVQYIMNKKYTFRIYKK